MTLVGPVVGMVIWRRPAIGGTAILARWTEITQFSTSLNCKYATGPKAKQNKVIDVYDDNPVLKGFVDYWNRKRSGREMPSRADIDPVEIPKLLPHLTLIDVVDGGSRFRFRLVGTALVQGYGRDYTGLYSDEVSPPASPHRDALSSLYRSVCNGRKPVFVRARYRMPNGLTTNSDRILAPLSRDGQAVDMLISALTFDYGRGPRNVINFDQDPEILTQVIDLT